MQSENIQTIKTKTPRVKMYREIDKLHGKMKILIFIMGLFIGALTYAICHFKNLSDHLYDELINMKKKNDTISESIVFLETQFDESVKLVASAYYVIDELNNQNKELIDQYNELVDETSILYERKELYDKYDYAIINAMGHRTNITYDQIKLAEEVAEKYDLPSPDLILGIIMTESGGNENAYNVSSGAFGYGQFLIGTGKYVYETLLNNKGKFSKDILFNGDIQIEMIGAYIDYLLDRSNGDLFAAIKQYCGDTSNTSHYTYDYINKIISYTGKSIYE